MPIITHSSKEAFGPQGEDRALGDSRLAASTAKSLTARAGVRPDVSERVLGHVIKGVIHDRHEYRQEKADALRKLAGLIAMIVNPPADNVRQLSH